MIVLLFLHVPCDKMQFSPCCMECRHGLAIRILSVCLSVWHCVTKWKKDRWSRFLYHTTDHLA